MINAKNLMSKHPFCLSPEDSMLDASRLLVEKNIRHIPVKKDGKIIGILSDRDVQRSMRIDRQDDKMVMTINSLSKISDFMNWPVMTVSEDTSIVKVIEDLLEQKVNALLVENSDREITGIITSEDILKYSLRIFKDVDEGPQLDHLY